jgi:hypothetical protein
MRRLCGQRVEHHQVKGLPAMQGFQPGDQGEPLGVGGTDALEGPTEKLDVRVQGELTAVGVPVEGRFFGDNEGAGLGDRGPAGEVAAVGEAGH